MSPRLGSSAYRSILPLLLEVPAASQAALVDSEKGTPPPVPPALTPVLARERETLSILLGDAFLPPQAALLPFPAEKGFLDVVRASYRAGQDAVSMANSRWVLTIEVTSHMRPDEAPIVRAQTIARAVFRVPEWIHLRQTGQDGKLVYGNQEPRPAGASGSAPSWADVLEWWQEGDSFGFATLKSIGGMTGLVVSPDPRLNQPWFAAEPR